MYGLIIVSLACQIDASTKLMLTLVPPLTAWEMQDIDRHDEIAAEQKKLREEKKQ